MTSSADNRFRLPIHSAPSRYEITLTPDLPNARFDGVVEVAVDTAEPSESLVLNAAELNIGVCEVDGEAAAFEIDDALERLTVSPDGGVDVGEHRLRIEFSGTLNDDLRGWYRSTYVDSDGVEQVIATSQMQSTDCRRAFPCWDEPAFKSVFSITMNVPEDLLAISNGSIIDRVPLGDGLDRVSFADTMPMSSYLVAMVVGPLEATDWVDVDGIPLRIVHTPGKGDLTDFGLEVGAFALRWFQEYYGIAYPADKVELVGLPDFAAGAMENLGCITFRENLLLVDPNTATQTERQNVVDVVAHELAHMWFGDLVTMRWWNGIWLNEAFATFMELAACDAFRPEWERWASFGLERSVAFETDSLKSTRPVEYHVESPADAEGMFDVLTYQKGGALLRMLEQHIGADKFRAGVSSYLDAHRYGNTETSDLWDAIEATTDSPVRTLMDSWIWQPGYPLISASLESGGLQLSQRRFSFDPLDQDDTKWVVPIGVRSSTGPARLVLDGSETVLPIDDDDQAIIVNADGHGFFRVAYSSDLLERFDPATLATMTTLERYSLVDDAWNSVIGGTTSTPDMLQLLSKFADEPSLDVWQRIGSVFSWYRRYLDDDEQLTRFQSFVRDVARPAYDRLGAPKADEPDLTRSLRGHLFSVLAVLGGDEQLQGRAAEIFEEWKNDPSKVDAELAAGSTGVLAATRGTDVYDEFESIALGSDNPQVAVRHLYSLASFDDDRLLRRTVDLAFSDQVKSQNAPFLLNSCIANRRFGGLAWEAVKDRWEVANERFPRNTIVRMVGAVRLLDRPDQVVDVAEFFRDHPIEQATKTLEQVLERQAVNAVMREREAPSLQAWFSR